MPVIASRHARGLLRDRVANLDAGKITGVADAGTIATWSDFSGLCNDAAQATEAAKPTLRLNVGNGTPVARFLGTNDLMTVAGLTGSFGGSDVPYSWCVVHAPADPLPGDGSILSFGEQVTAFCELQLGNGNNRRDDAVASANVSGGGSTAAVFEVDSHSFAGTTVTTRKNGAVVQTDEPQNVGVLTSNRFAIGARVLGAGYSNFMLGDIARIDIHSRALSVQEMNYQAARGRGRQLRPGV